LASDSPNNAIADCHIPDECGSATNGYSMARNPKPDLRLYSQTLENNVAALNVDDVGHGRIEPDLRNTGAVPSED
jgi:hypothetical protein